MGPLNTFSKGARAITIMSADVKSYKDFEQKFEDFANKLILCQENDIQITINMVMVPDWLERDWENALFFHDQGINVTLKPQSDPTASRVVEGYTDEMLKRLLFKSKHK